MFSQKFKAVFFDWDNTIVDAWPMLFKASNAVMHHFGFAEISLEEVKIRARTSTRESFPKMFGISWQEAQEIFYKVVDECSSEISVYEGVLDKLNLLKAAGYKLVIISNKKKQILHDEIVRLNVPNDLILGSGDASCDKPDPEMGLIALSQLNLKPKEVVYVGDSVTDWVFAKNLGVSAVAIGDEDYEGHLLGRFSSVNQFADILLAK